MGELIRFPIELAMRDAVTAAPRSGRRGWSPVGRLVLFPVIMRRRLVIDDPFPRAYDRIPAPYFTDEDAGLWNR